MAPASRTGHEEYSSDSKEEQQLEIYLPSNSLVKSPYFAEILAAQFLVASSYRHFLFLMAKWTSCITSSGEDCKFSSFFLGNEIGDSLGKSSEAQGAIGLSNLKEEKIQFLYPSEIENQKPRPSTIQQCAMSPSPFPCKPGLWGGPQKPSSSALVRSPAQKSTSSPPSNPTNKQGGGSHGSTLCTRNSQVGSLVTPGWSCSARITLCSETIDGTGKQTDAVGMADVSPALDLLRQSFKLSSTSSSQSNFLETPNPHLSSPPLLSCPIDLKEAVCSLIFASPRCADIPELMDVRKHFVAKYGKEFVTSALELRPECGVSRMVVEKLSAKAPDIETKVKILAAVAKEHNVNWDSKALEEQLQKPNEDLLNGPNSFSSSSKMLIDSVNVKLSPDASQESAAKNLKTNIGSEPTGSNSSSHASIRAPSPLAPPTQHSSVSEIKTGSGSKDSFPVKEESALNRSKWKMEFEDAASAAQVAAESAERASMAARAAAELASRGNISRQNSNESTRSSIRRSRNERPDRVISSNSTNPVSVDCDQLKGLQETKEQVNKLQRDEVVEGSSHSSKNSEDHIEFSSRGDAPMEQKFRVQESFSWTAPIEQNTKIEEQFGKEDIESKYDRSAFTTSAGTSSDDTFLVQTDRGDNLDHNSPKISAGDVLSRHSSDERHTSSHYFAAVFDEYGSESNDEEENFLNSSWKKQDQVSSFASTSNVANSNFFNNSHQEMDDVTLEKAASNFVDSLPVTFDDSDGESEDDTSGSQQNETIQHQPLSSLDAVQHQPLSSLEAQSLTESEIEKKIEVTSSFLGTKSSEMSDEVAKGVEQGLNFGKLTGGFRNRGYILPPYSSSSVIDSSSVTDTSDNKTTLAPLDKSSTSFENAGKERYVEKSSLSDPLPNSRISSISVDPVSGKTSEEYLKGSSHHKTSGEDAVGFGAKLKKYELNNSGTVLTPIEQGQYDSHGSSNPDNSDLDKTSRISELDQKIYELKKRAKAYKESIPRTSNTDVDSAGNAMKRDSKLNANTKTNTKLSRRTRDSPPQAKKADILSSSGSSNIQPETFQGNPTVALLPESLDQSTTKSKEKQRSANQNSSAEKSSTQTESKKASSGHGSGQEASNSSKGNQKPSESGSGGILPDSYLKNTSHVHPKLPDYDTLAAHFQPTYWIGSIRNRFETGPVITNSVQNWLNRTGSDRFWGVEPDRFWPPEPINQFVANETWIRITFRNSIIFLHSVRTLTKLQNRILIYLHNMILRQVKILAPALAHQLNLQVSLTSFKRNVVRSNLGHEDSTNHRPRRSRIILRNPGHEGTSCGLLQRQVSGARSPSIALPPGNQGEATHANGYKVPLNTSVNRLTPLRVAVSRNSLSFGVSWDPHILRQYLLVLSLRPGKMVARMRKTNSAARSIHVGEPCVRASDDEASTSTFRRRARSASSSRGTRVSKLQGMLANLTDMVIGLTAQQAVILRQTQPICAVLPLPPVAAVLVPRPSVPAAPVPPPPVAAIPEVIPLPQAALAPLLPIPAVAEIPAPAPQAAPLSLQSSGSSRPPIRPFRF
ncbi:hypothetical protein AXF42_Ash014595 [Apostasia shenzhenica]|uniref:Uncharacterized protein n=1 Tax=Apostasia shenzhenica TaxID=1088818 RepID=A0A2I0AK35_9ASPA|nr:hypothetical protein AXF42_Ash014595 [Apostasia shenzhenica]